MSLEKKTEICAIYCQVQIHFCKSPVPDVNQSYSDSSKIIVQNMPLTLAGFPVIALNSIWVFLLKKEPALITCVCVCIGKDFDDNSNSVSTDNSVNELRMNEECLSVCDLQVSILWTNRSDVQV